MRISRSERRLLIILCVVALCAGYWMFILSPALSNGARLSEERDAAREEIARNAQGDGRLASLKAEADAAMTRLLNAYPGLSAKRDQAAWTRAIEQICSKNARLVSLRFGEDTRDGALGVQIAQLEARTAENTVSAFIEDLSAAQPLMSITQFTAAMEGDGQSLVKVTLSIPYIVE